MAQPRIKLVAKRLRLKLRARATSRAYDIESGEGYAVLSRGTINTIPVLLIRGDSGIKVVVPARYFYENVRPRGLFDKR